MSFIGPSKHSLLRNALAKIRPCCQHINNFVCSYNCLAIKWLHYNAVSANLCDMYILIPG